MHDALSSSFLVSYNKSCLEQHIDIKHKVEKASKWRKRLTFFTSETCRQKENSEKIFLCKVNTSPEKCKRQRDLVVIRSNETSLEFSMEKLLNCHNYDEDGKSGNNLKSCPSGKSVRSKKASKFLKKQQIFPCLSNMLNNSTKRVDKKFKETSVGTNGEFSCPRCERRRIKKLRRRMFYDTFSPYYNIGDNRPPLEIAHGLRSPLFYNARTIRNQISAASSSSLTSMDSDLEYIPWQGNSRRYAKSHILKNQMHDAPRRKILKNKKQQCPSRIRNSGGYKIIATPCWEETLSKNCGSNNCSELQSTSSSFWDYIIDKIAKKQMKHDQDVDSLKCCPCRKLLNPDDKTKAQNCECKKTQNCECKKVQAGSSVTAAQTKSTVEKRPSVILMPNLNKTCMQTEDSCFPQPNSSLPQPNSGLPQPNSCLLPPNSCLAQPNTCFPQPNSSLPQPNSSLPQPNSSLPQPNTCFPQPNSSLPQPNTFFPQPNSSLPQPNTCFPQPNSSSPQPKSCLPQPNSCFPQPNNYIPNIIPNTIPNTVPNTIPNFIPNIIPNNTPNTACDCLGTMHAVSRDASPCLKLAEKVLPPSFTSEKKQEAKSKKPEEPRKPKVEKTCQGSHETILKKLKTKYNGEILCIHNPPCILINGCLNLPPPRVKPTTVCYPVTQIKKASAYNLYRRMCRQKLKKDPEKDKSKYAYIPANARLPARDAEDVKHSFFQKHLCELVRMCSKPHYGINTASRRTKAIKKPPRVIQKKRSGHREHKQDPNMPKKIVIVAPGNKVDIPTPSKSNMLSGETGKSLGLSSSPKRHRSRLLRMIRARR